MDTYILYTNILDMFVCTTMAEREIAINVREQKKYSEEGQVERNGRDH